MEKLWSTSSNVDPYTDQQGVLDEENRGVVASQVPVALLGVELDSKASRVPHRVCRPRLSSCRTEQCLAHDLQEVTLNSVGVGAQTEGVEFPFVPIGQAQNETFLFENTTCYSIVKEKPTTYDPGGCMDSAELCYCGNMRKLCILGEKDN